MNISRLFWWVYQLPPVSMIGILLTYTLMFLRLNRRLQKRLWWRAGIIALLSLWVFAALWTTILNRRSGTDIALLLVPFHSYREFLDTANLEILRSSFMNVALFYPAGLLLAALLPKQRRAAVTIAVLAVFSLSIELVQYFQLLGRAEIDDVIHNTLGAVLGAASIRWERQQFFPDINRQN